MAEKEYIERGAVLLKIDLHGTNKFGMLDEDVREFIKQIPAADVVEVVRCKDCKYFQTAKVNNKGFLICPASGMEITETDYCSYGERKDG